jgi:GNAT superfamily N-acetyltransferase
MAHDLDIHPASPDELVAAHRNVFDIWSKGLPLDEHVRYRLNSPSHRRATWFVGTINGHVATSLGCYPVGFHLRGKNLSGIAIGSVYTLAEYRGRGFAPRLLVGVEDYARRRQAALSVMYSDIGADYYAQLGYQLCPSLEGWCEPRKLPYPAGESRLVPISPAEHLPAIMMLYAEYHDAMPLSVAREAEYWQAILQKSGTDEFHALREPSGAWQGYVRIGHKGDDWRITDFALADQLESSAEQLYLALGELARAGGAARVGGWLSDSNAARKFFELTPRKTEITMIKSLVDSDPLDEATIAGTSRFCEIDHV